MDSTQVPYSIRFEMYGAFLDLPVHASFALPDIDRLFLRELIAQAMPGGCSGVGHCFDEMSHDVDSCGRDPA